MRAVRSLLPAGLRWRLTAWVAAVMVFSAAALFVVVYQDTGTQLRSEIDRDLAGDTAQLSQSLGALNGRSATEIASAATRYVHARPYTSSSTLLFVLIAGSAPASNHPEVFGAPRPEFGENGTDQTRENRVAATLRRARTGYSTQLVPDVGRVRILERVLDLSSPRVVVGAGEPLATVEHAQRGVARAFLLAGVVVIALALLASYLAGARVSAPLRRMAAVATRVNAGELEPRMELPAQAAGEVRVLADAFNHMLDRLAEAFTYQRSFIADASHELRTPLTVIRGQLEVLAAQQQPSGEEVRRVERLVQAEITRVSRLVDDLLFLAQAERTDFLREEWFDMPPFVTELWDGVSLTAERRFELGAMPEGSLRADPDRLAQALRNLARNAVEHTAEGDGLVRLEVDSLAAGQLRFAVIDDGPGIPVEERERIFERFHRVDSAKSRSNEGAGLGLAIVRAIVEAHGGEVAARASGNGRGTRVEFVLPDFRRR